MEMWFTERHTDNLTAQVRVRETLHREKTQYQELAILDTEEYGRMLVLDGIIQTTEKDEFIYHDMMTHIALSAHPHPKKALVIGGGDGGSVREILKHDTIEEIHMVELDERVSAVCKEYLPSLSHALDDEKVKIFYEDGIQFVKAKEGVYDVIVVDSTDPIGPSIGLFSHPFYTSCFRALTEEGMLTAHSEPPFFQPGLVKQIFDTISSVFPMTRLCLATIPTYSPWNWSFTIGSKVLDPTVIRTPLRGKTRYYSKEVHASSFVLPPFIQELLT